MSARGGPVEQAIRRDVAPGAALSTAAGNATFVVKSLDKERLLLLLGQQQVRTGLSWACLEGVVPFLARKGWIRVGGQRKVAGDPGNLDEYLKGCIKRDTSAYVAAVLHTAGVTEVDPGPPARIRLADTFA